MQLCYVSLLDSKNVLHGECLSSSQKYSVEYSKTSAQKNTIYPAYTSFFAKYVRYIDTSPWHGMHQLRKLCASLMCSLKSLCYEQLRNLLRGSREVSRIKQYFVCSKTLSQKNIIYLASSHMVLPRNTLHWYLTMPCLKSHNYVSSYLKTLETFGNCQRPVFSLGVSQHTCMPQIINLSKFELNWPSKLWDNNGRKNTLVTQSCVL